jgi:hypothetical protein
MALHYRDLHVHTRHSHDVRDEAMTMENLARWGAEAGIAVGFADHLDARDFGQGGVRTFEEIMDEYIRGERAMVASGLADCLPHVNVVFRGHRGIFQVPREVEERGRREFMDLSREALARGMAVECNLLGMVDDSHADPSPSWDMLEELAGEGATLYVGSDAHDSAGFKKGIPLVIEAHERLERAGAGFLTYP